MLYGAAYWPVAENDALAKMGFDGTGCVYGQGFERCCVRVREGSLTSESSAMLRPVNRHRMTDSKALTAAKRTELFEALKKCGKIGYVVHSISAAEISAKMLRKYGSSCVCLPPSQTVHDARVSRCMLCSPEFRILLTPFRTTLPSGW